MGSTICLVEDELLLRAMSQADLEDIGFEVIPVTTCQEAWQLIGSGTRIDCLLTDIRTPGPMDGWQLARQSRDLVPELPVIYVSGYSGSETHPVPGSIFLTKPYRLADLEEALSALGLAPEVQPQIGPAL